MAFEQLMAESMRKQDKKKGKEKDSKDHHHFFQGDKGANAHGPDTAEGKSHQAPPPSV